MRSRELQALLAQMTGRTIADIDMRVRALRAAGDIFHGPRGRHARHLSAAEIALHVLALVPRKSPETGELLAKLQKSTKYVPHRDHADYLPKQPSLATMLGYAIDEIAESGGSTIQGFEILENCERAWMTIERSDGRRAKLLFMAGGDPLYKQARASVEDYELIDGFTLGHRLVIGASLLRVLASKAREATEATVAQSAVRPEAAAHA